MMVPDMFRGAGLADYKLPLFPWLWLCMCINMNMHTQDSDISFSHSNDSFIAAIRFQKFNNKRRVNKRNSFSLNNWLWMNIAPCRKKRIKGYNQGEVKKSYKDLD